MRFELAQAELEEVESEQQSTQADYDEIFDNLLDLAADIVGINDAKDCLLEGDLVACLWTVVGFSPWGKGAKLAKAAPKILKLWNRWRKAKKVKAAADSKVKDVKEKYDKAKQQKKDTPTLCDVTDTQGGKRNYVVSIRLDSGSDSYQGDPLLNGSGVEAEDVSASTPDLSTGEAAQPGETDEELYDPDPIFAPAKERKPWKITAEKSTAVANGGPFGVNYYKQKPDAAGEVCWWSPDKAGHGGSAWKVYEETKTGLKWVDDADEYGEFMRNKHKGEKGKFIPWKKLKMAKGC